MERPPPLKLRRTTVTSAKVVAEQITLSQTEREALAER